MFPSRNSVQQPQKASIPQDNPIHHPSHRHAKNPANSSSRRLVSAFLTHRCCEMCHVNSLQPHPGHPSLVGDGAVAAAWRCKEEGKKHHLICLATHALLVKRPVSFKNYYLWLLQSRNVPPTSFSRCCHCYLLCYTASSAVCSLGGRGILLAEQVVVSNTER